MTTYGNQPTTTHSGRPNKEQFNGQLVDRLFVRFKSIWGHLWASQFKDEKSMLAAKREWALALRYHSETDVNYMISQAKRDGERPPTLPRFMKYPPPYRHVTVAQLTGACSTKQRAASEMAKIREKHNV